MRNILACIVFGLMCWIGYAQSNTSKSHAIGLKVDNDVFLFNLQDQYYTHGADLSYYFSQQPDKGFNTIDIQQKIFNPFSGNIYQIERQDRPFAGIFMVQYTKNRIIKEQYSIKYGLALGWIGSNTQLDDFQTAYHQWFGIYNIRGWDTQIKNAPIAGVVFEGKYQQPINSRWDANAQIAGVLGYNMDNLKIGGTLRYGLNPLKRFAKSQFYNPTQSSSEWFVFFQPEIIHQIYDASIQGDMNDHSSPLTFDIRSWVPTYRLGMHWANNGWSLGYVFQKQMQQPVINNRLYSSHHQYATIYAIIPIR